MAGSNTSGARPDPARPPAGTLAREILDHLSEGCQILGFDWRYLYLNEAAARQGRSTREALLGRTMMEAYPGIDGTPLFETLRRCRDARTFELLENEFTFPDGATGWFELRIEPVPEGVFVLSLDITERKRADQQVRHLAAVLGGLRDVNQLIVRERDPQALVERACALLVGSRGFDSCSILVPDHCGKRLVARAGERQDRETREVPLACEGRSYGALVVSLSSRTAVDLEEQGVLQEIASDLAFALRGMEVAAELRRSEEEYRALFENAQVGMFRSKLDGSAILAANRKLCEIHGRTEAELLGNPAVIRWADPAARERMTSILREHGSVSDHQIELVAASGEVKTCLISARLFPEQGYLDGTVVDLTDRQQGTERLGRSEERFRELFGRMGSGVAVFEAVDGGQDFVFRDLNAAGEARAKLSRDAVVGKRVTELFPNVEAAGFLALLRQVFTSGEPLHQQATRYQDERVSEWLELFAYRLSSGEVVAITDDRTDLHKTEEQLRQAQKMEAVGRLAGGVAHDFNNMLSVVLSHAGFLLEDLTQGDPLRDDAEQIRLAGERAAALTRQLLAFSRKQLLQPEAVDLNEVVARAEKLLRRLIGEDVELRCVLAPGRVVVHADRGQLEQVLMNLAINARDAMPEGGTLILETARVDQAAAPKPGGKVGPHVLLAVSDTGHGMDAATQARVFEPFYTTKPADKGTGLGLSTVHGIVQQSGGTIWLYSEPGRGTTFKIYLPELEGEPDAVPRQTPPPLVGGSETILLVEDEEAVRRVATEILRRHGYELLEAANAAEALELAASHRSVIHLVVTDVVMPVSSGRDLAECLAVYRPGIPVLFMSGYTDSAILQQQVLEAGADFLQKPLTPERLARKVREILDRGGAA